MHTICVNIFPLSYSTPLNPLKGFWMDMLKVMVLDLKLEAISPADLLRARIFQFFKLLLDFIEARFTPYTKGNVSHLYISISWFQKHGFHHQDHQQTLL